MSTIKPQDRPNALTRAGDRRLTEATHERLFTQAVASGRCADAQRIAGVIARIQATAKTH